QLVPELPGEGGDGQALFLAAAAARADLDAMRGDALSAEANARAAGADYFPVLTGGLAATTSGTSADWGPFGDLTGQVALVQPLWEGGRTVAAVRAAEADARAARARVAAAERDLWLELL